MPELNPSNLAVQAGGDTKTLTASLPKSPPSTDLVCGPITYRWSAVSSPALPFSASGETATFTPPMSLCQSDGVSYLYRVEALDGSNIPSNSKYFAVQVKPSGALHAPVHQRIRR